MECVGHIQKRLGKRLRGLKKKTFVDDSGQVRKIKWGGKGCLTESVINSLSVYFGGAIRNFPGDMDGIFRAIWAVFHHSISDDDQHDHQFCPTGSDSWCKYNRALADNVEPPKHTPKLPKDLGPFIKPVFTALSKRELLEKCVFGVTQNQNESFNRSRCPKTGFCSVVSVDIAVNLAAITFNHGLEGLSPLFEQVIGSPPSAFTANYISSSDDKRSMKAGQSAQTRDGENPCDVRSWRWRKDASLVKASLTNLVDFDVHCDLPTPPPPFFHIIFWRWIFKSRLFGLIWPAFFRAIF